VEIPDTRYARASDGAYIAYQTAGEGPIDYVWQFDHTGDVDLMWEHPEASYWFPKVTSFCRLILHDRRGTGLSSRNVPPPNLETRASDLRVVLDTIGSDRPVLGGYGEAGAANVVFAATYPERVRSLVWVEPLPRVAWTPDFPWGVKPAYVEAEMRALELWGTNAYGAAWAESEETEGLRMAEDEVRIVGMLSRHTTTPDVALELTRIWHETDVRGALPSVQAPALLLASEAIPDSLEVARYVAGLMPNATVASIPGYDRARLDHEVEVFRSFLGVERPVPELDTVLSTVLFTDIVGSTQKQAELGDRAWKDLVLQHHAVVRASLDRYHGVENDTAGDGFYATFDGPARAIRCALEVVDRVRPLQIEIRAGVHTGEMEHGPGGEIRGIAVHTGARVAALAGPGEILVSRTIRDLVAGASIRLESHGVHQLKGVPGSWEVFAVAS